MWVKDNRPKWQKKWLKKFNELIINSN